MSNLMLCAPLIHGNPSLGHKEWSGSLDTIVKGKEFYMFKLWLGGVHVGL